MGVKNRQIKQEKETENAKAVSIPAPDTTKTLDRLINDRFLKGTDKIMTNHVKYKAPDIYNAGGDLSKQWFVYYSFRDPKTEKFKRFKVFRDINTGKTFAERTEKAKAIQMVINDLLLEGFNPFKEYSTDTTFVFINCIDTFLEDIKPQLKPKSYNRFYYEFRIMKQWFIDNGLDNILISEVKKSHIFDFLAFAKKRGQWTSGKTYNTHKSNISRMFNYFINNYDDALEKNPVAKIESKPVKIRGNQPYNDDEFTAIKEAILERDPYLWRICQFVYYAAVRNEQEGLNLLVGDIDFTTNQLIIRSDISKGKKKQFIPLYPTFVDVLKNEMKLDTYPKDYFIFGRGDEPGPVRVGKDNFYDRFKKIRNDIGLSKNHGIYSFKHTRGCHMVEDGSSLYEIQTLFRHESLQATMEYLKSIGRVIDKKVLSETRVV